MSAATVSEMHPRRARPMQHALALGVVGLVVSLMGTVATWNRGPEFGPKWYPLALVVVAIPCAWVGGRFHKPRGEGRTHE